MSAPLPSGLRAFLSRLSELTSRRRIRQELDDEIALHLDLEIAHNVAQGMTPEEARRKAMLSFGGVQRFREETGDTRGFPLVESLARDLRLTLRRLRRTP